MNDGPFLLAASPSPEWVILETSGYRLFPDVDLTVIITLYNYSQYISHCLDSVLESILYDYSLAVEVVVIDDASTDSSRDVVRSWMKTHDDQRVVLIEKSLNSGLSRSRNLGICLSRGESIFILDADNFIQPACFSELHRNLITSSHSAVFSVISKCHSESSEILGLVSDRPFDLNSLICSNYIDAMAIFKKSALFDVGLYDVEMVYGWEDYDLWLSLGFAGHSVGFLPLPLANYRVHANSMLQRLNEKVVHVARYLLEKHASHLDLSQLPDFIFGCPKSTLISGE